MPALEMKLEETKGLQNESLPYRIGFSVFLSPFNITDVNFSCLPKCILLRSNVSPKQHLQEQLVP